MVDNNKRPDHQPAWSPAAGEKEMDSLENPEDSNAAKLTPQRSTWRKVIDILDWTPPWCRYDPNKPPTFSIWHNLLFALAGLLTIGNLYYNHPILNVLAEDFNVSYVTVSRIPTLMQAGYATGLLFVCPLGDLLRRRPLTLGLIGFTATIWIGLCVTPSFAVFCALSFITAVTTVIPQVMLPLVAELAPPHKRAMALSIATCGNLLGIVVARILAGVVANYTSWRNIYWIALGLQYLILVLLWLFMPDYPSSNPDGLNYFKMIGGIVLLYKKHAVLVQASLISFCISSTFTSFWTTLTFLLANAPYNYSPVIIGLFALIGLAAIGLGPLYAKFLIQPFAPLFSTMVGCGAALVGVIIGTYTGRHTLAGPVIQAFALDAGMQITQVANRASIHAIEPTGRNRVNTAFMLLTFLGQLTGTSAGAKLYARGGWVASGSLSVGFLVLTFAIAVVRGPYEPGWLGWSGGWDIRKQNLAQATSDPAPVPAAPAAVAVAADAHPGEKVDAAVAAATDDDEEKGHQVVTPMK